MVSTISRNVLNEPRTNWPVVDGLAGSGRRGTTLTTPPIAPWP
ncbi:MAG: hypothetical protein WDO24_27975 [Pseudomonadota bacterium]